MTTQSKHIRISIPRQSNNRIDLSTEKTVPIHKAIWNSNGCIIQFCVNDLTPAEIETVMEKCKQNWDVIDFDLVLNPLKGKI